MRTIGCIFFYIVSISLFCTCSSHKKELRGIVEHMQSQTITIPYEQMTYWTTDSILDISPWKDAKLRLIHYVDSKTCSSCYLQKIAKYDFLFNMEKLSNNEFFNVFIINPDNKTKRILESEYYNKLIPSTIFIDTANVFRQKNPIIPSETMYHTFLLDEKGKIILVGNPMVNNKIEKMLISIVEDKLAKKIPHKN